MVGHHRDERQLWRGFLLSAGAFRTIDIPGAAQTMVYALNARGDVTGMDSGSWTAMACSH